MPEGAFLNLHCCPEKKKTTTCIAPIPTVSTASTSSTSFERPINAEVNTIELAVPFQKTVSTPKKAWHPNQLCSESSDDSESDVLPVLPTKRLRIPDKKQLVDVPLIVTVSESTQTPPINEDSAHYLIVEKALSSQLQIQEIKNQKLNKELEFSRLQTVKILAEVDQMKIQLQTKVSQSVTLRESPTLLNRAEPSTLRPGEIIML